MLLQSRMCSDYAFIRGKIPDCEYRVMVVLLNGNILVDSHDWVDAN